MMEIIVRSIPAGVFFPRISIVYTTHICLRDAGNLAFYVLAYMMSV